VRSAEDGPAVFLLGYGNPGRRDDGLGPWIAEELEGRCGPEIEIRTAFQPGIEHCAEMRAAGAVVFVDAAREGPAPFRVAGLAPGTSGPDPGGAAVAGFSSHIASPAALVAICGESFGSCPSAWIVGVRGFDFGAGEGLSRRAERNARLTLAFLQALLGRGKGAFMGTEARNKTILIVDDDSDVRATLRIILESAGFTVGEAADGEAGLKIAERIKPDAILLDLMMETVDAGSKVSTRLKESGFACPIFLLSAAGDSVRYTIGTRELGLAGIFQKPVDPNALLTTLRTKLKVT
jgi:hydrogenase maturation protease